MADPHDGPIVISVGQSHRYYTVNAKLNKFASLTILIIIGITTCLVLTDTISGNFAGLWRHPTLINPAPETLWLAAINRSLLPWEGGIKRELIDQTIEKFSFDEGYPSVAVGFYGGKAYLLKPLNFSRVAWHYDGILLANLLRIVQLENQDPPPPDVEFILGGSDEVLLDRSPEGLPWPMMRYCTRPGRGFDILVPGEFWYLRDEFDERLLKNAHLATTYPWKDRIDKLSCNAGGYHRDGDFLGFGGKNGRDENCTDDQPCSSPREYFISHVVPRYPDLMSEGDLPPDLEGWSSHKYIMHLDGISCSTRLPLYLSMGFTTFVEQSGYQQHFQPWMRPYVDHIPVWKKGPEDIPVAVKWARKHDAQAEAIGKRAREFAETHLTSSARLKYWMLLLQEYSKLLDYPIQKRQGAISLSDHLFTRPGCDNWNWFSWKEAGYNYTIQNFKSWKESTEFVVPDTDACFNE